MSGDFYGLPTQSLENRYLHLEYLVGAGPRIVRVVLAGTSTNLLAELPGATLPSAVGEYTFYGGHRLWHAPESSPRSYVPDDEPVAIETLPDGVRLTQRTEALTGIRKSLEIRLHPDRPEVTVDHRLINEGIWPIELAPWGITQLPLGGVAILPQSNEPLDQPGLLPNRQLVLWPYTRWQDPRLHLEDDLILMQADPLMPPCKIGYFSRAGWIGYLRDGTLFQKLVEPRPGAPYPDFGCNSEFYCCDRFIEMETLAPLTRLEPGQGVDHRETWRFLTGVGDARSVSDVRELIRGIPG